MNLPTVLRVSQSMVWISAVLILFSCNPHKGFEDLGNGIYRRLDRFGECEPSVANADYYIMEMDIKEATEVRHYEVHFGPADRDNSGKLAGDAILNALHDSLNCGEQVTIYMPSVTYLESWLCPDSTELNGSDEIEIRLYVRQTFNAEEYYNYLVHAAQNDELDEKLAIELLLANKSRDPYETWGDCILQRVFTTAGDSIKAGDEITIEYSTSLLNGQKLDTLTRMQFIFGKPGQLVGGFEYGLSLLRAGEHAHIYLPSYLAFGEDGSSTGLVPPHTPVSFDVKVLEVKKPKKSFKNPNTF